ncbi:MAG TPA: urea ABC transporter permease subunit UrtB [Verrucomicrobiota bacterium]|nr:urea ABC transporter permease subunit UrtB [Verrucomicrobiota bacterium]
MKKFATTILLLCLTLLAVLAEEAPESPQVNPTARETFVRAVLTEDGAEQIELIKQLVNAGDDLVSRGLAAWRVSELFLYEASGGAKIPFVLDARLDSDGKAKAIRLADGEFIKDAAGTALTFSAVELTPVDNNSRLRRAIKTTLDLYAIGNPKPKMRRDAIVKLGQEQNVEYLPHFEGRLKVEKDKMVIKSLNEAIALTHTVNDDPAVRNAAIVELGEMRSINALSFLKELQKSVQKDPTKYGDETAAALRTAIIDIENYIRWGNFVGTAFRGFSLAAVLLVAALGLAITFGLMGVINMAHGEVMAVGAYTTYIVQGVFGTGLLFSLFGKTVTVKGAGLTGGGFDMYFFVALVASFITGALVGLALERGIIRFLYKRPLESLLATWGVSLVIQQILRHTFGAANVQVDSPSFLSGSFVVDDVLFAYNRLFIIGFALFIVFGTYLLLTKTSLGLQIRAVMQNRNMASCMGVRTDRVNMMTFAFGSGLAGMAGACLSQIANVGPSLGQSYIVDCFMIVVLGGVGNLVGTVTASLGVGVTNQILEPWLGAVLGKILVLTAIILFLQWRPNGIFVTKSRSLDS